MKVFDLKFEWKIKAWVYSELWGDFPADRGWLQALRLCCGTPLFCGKDIPMLKFCFCLLAGGGVKFRRNCIETLDFSISIYILLLHSLFNAFTCSWYISNTYHSPVNFQINSKFCIRSSPVYWSRLGRNCYGTDTYLPNSYSRLGVNICSVRVPLLPIWWRH